MKRSLIYILLFFACASFRAAAQSAPVLNCSVTGPDSIFFDKVNYNRYLPDTFTVHITLINTGGDAADSVVVFPRSNPRFTVIAPAAKLVSKSLAPSDTVQTQFDLIVNPRDVSGVDTLIIAVSAKAGGRTECLLPIWVEKEYRPVNEIICPPDSSITIHFVDSLNSYVPNPIAFPVIVINHGDAPSKESRIMYVATPGVAPADGQDAIIDVGDLAAGGGRVDKTFMLNVVRRATDTTVMLRFKVQGKGGLGDRIIDTVCSFALFIPRANDVSFQLECHNAPDIKFEAGRYVPNPFQWVVKVRNTGNGRAKNVLASISLPSLYELDTSTTSPVSLGDMQKDEEKTITWLVHALPSTQPDTSEICVHVIDQFNRIAQCCDTVTLPSVRVPSIEASCLVVPDSIGVDPQTGMYKPSQFIVRAQVHNRGNDTADMVYAEIVINDPDITLGPPGQTKLLLALKLPPQGVVDTLWTLIPLPTRVARDPIFTVRATAANCPSSLTSCGIHIAAALQPLFECAAATIPKDTLHYSIATLEYDSLYFTVQVRNSGTAAAQNAQATILLPSNLSLPPTEAPVKYYGVPFPTDSVWTVRWKITPMKQREGSLDTISVEFRSGPLKSICFSRIFVIGIPPITVLSIPTNFVERYNRTLQVPVHIDQSSNKDIRSMAIAIRYDTNKVDFLSFDRAGSLLDSSWAFVPSPMPGLIYFVAANPVTQLSGEGDLIYLNFRVRFGSGPDILSISGTPLSFDTTISSVNNGTVLARYFDGYIYVSGDCLYPLKASENFVILGNKPNPFNPSTTILYALKSAVHVRLTVSDVYGRVRAVVMEGDQGAGEHEARFEAGALPSGMYFCTLEAGGEQHSIRIVIAK